MGVLFGELKDGYSFLLCVRMEFVSLPSSIPNPDLRIGTKVILDSDIVSAVNSYPMGEIS